MLSLCMIVKDEEQNLPRCLTSVQGVVDEIIIVDTGSSDRTPQIAAEWGAQLIHSPWTGDFAAARNISLSHATGDWILVLDADETLVPEGWATVLSHLDNANYLVITALRQEIGAAQTPYSLVSRIFRRHPEVRFSRPYHELIDDSVLALQQREPHWQILELPQVVIRHDGYRTQAVVQQQKLARAQQGMARSLLDNPHTPYDYAKSGALHLELGQIEPAIDLLQQGLALAPTAPADRYELHFHLGLAYSRCQQLDAAFEHYQLALDQPILPILKLGAYNNLGSLLHEAEFPVAAQDLFETAIALDPTFALGHYNLGLVKRALGDLAGAIAAYQQALELDGDRPEIHQNLGVALLKLGQLAASQQAFQRALALYRQTNPAAAQTLKEQLAALGFRNFG